jgi:hypothetical protein
VDQTNLLNVHVDVLKASALAVAANLRVADIDPLARDETLIHGS